MSPKKEIFCLSVGIVILIVGLCMLINYISNANQRAFEFQIQALNHIQKHLDKTKTQIDQAIADAQLRGATELEIANLIWDTTMESCEHFQEKE